MKAILSKIWMWVLAIGALIAAAAAALHYRGKWVSEKAAHAFSRRSWERERTKIEADADAEAAAAEEGRKEAERHAAEQAKLAADNGRLVDLAKRLAAHASGPERDDVRRELVVEAERRVAAGTLTRAELERIRAIVEGA